MHYLDFSKVKYTTHFQYFIKVSFIFVLFLFVCGCSPTIHAPATPGTSIAILTEKSFMTTDDTELPIRTWMPAGDVQGVIVGVHGFNDYSNFIRDNAPFFNEHNIAIYSYDQRGFGATQTRGYWSGWPAMVNDLATLVRLIKEKYAHTPVYILGDSMGGAVTIVTMTEGEPLPVEGVILVAPAVWARSQMPFYQRFALWFAAHTIPWKVVTGESMDITPSDNIEMLRELGKDPLVIRGTRIGVVHGLSNLMDEAFKRAEKITSKVLLIYGEKDEIIPRPPVINFYERLPHTADGRQRLILYENGYHMLLRDLQAELVLNDLVEWIHVNNGSDS